MGTRLTTPTHRTLVEQVGQRFCWALQRIADSAILAEGECTTDYAASDAAVESGHTLGLACVDQADSLTAVMR